MANITSIRAYPDTRGEAKESAFQLRGYASQLALCPELTPAQQERARIAGQILSGLWAEMLCEDEQGGAA